MDLTHMKLLHFKEDSACEIFFPDVLVSYSSGVHELPGAGIDSIDFIRNLNRHFLGLLYEALNNEAKDKILKGEFKVNDEATLKAVFVRRNEEELEQVIIMLPEETHDIETIMKGVTI